MNAEATARAVLDAAMPESQLQSLVLELAALTGWLAHHQRIPIRFGRDGQPRAVVEGNTDPGFPDLVLINQVRGVVLFVELKRESGRLSYAQMQWRDAIVRSGGRFYLWRPSDWPEVECVLKGER